MQDVYIVAAKRTPVGNLMGSLASLPAHKLGSTVIKAVLEQTSVPADAVGEVVMGQVLVGGQGMNPVRQAALDAGLSIETPAWGVSHVCGSGMKSIALGATSIANGIYDIVIAGGQESMSMASHAAYVRAGQKMGSMEMVDMMLNDGLTDAFSKALMGVTAENVAKKYNLSRDAQDEYALNSQQKASNAQKSGRFKDEIAPVTIKVKREDVLFSDDEFIKHDAAKDALAKLRPAFDKEGTVTAGNASGINDGAAVVMLASKEALKKYNLKPLARIVGFGQGGVAPELMGTGPIAAVPKALAQAGWKLDDLDLIESNEAFAATSMSVDVELKWDLNKVNVNGGSIAIGHPIGASGARIVTTLVHEMQKRSAKKGLATMCIGGGMGVAICLEGC